MHKNKDKEFDQDLTCLSRRSASRGVRTDIAGRKQGSEGERERERKRDIRKERGGANKKEKCAFAKKPKEMTR